MDALVRHVRFALRSMWRAPAFTVVAVGTLALGIGANTAIFSVVDGVLLRDLPYDEPEALVTAWLDLSRREGPLRERLSYPDFLDFRSEPVALVSREFGERVWPDDGALGRRLRWGGPEAEFRTVVGAVEDVKNQVLMEADKPFVYLSLGQQYRAMTHVVAKATRGMATVAPALRASILAVDPSLSLASVVSLQSFTSLGILPQGLAAGIASSLGLLALLLSGIGVYGVVALAVTQRTKEIGIRMALGARRGSVLRMIVGGGIGLALPGVVFGGAAGIGLGYVMRSFLLGLSPTDPVTLAVVSATLLLVVLLASLIPGRQASAVEPVVALRTQ
jgi:hypothetical protein